MAPLVVKFDPERVHALYPEASMVPAMKISQLPKNKKDRLKEFCDSGDYLASIKIDGFFYMLNKTPNHTYLFSRSPGVNGLLTEKIANVPHILSVAQTLPADTLLVGEIFVPTDKTSKAVTRIMGCKPDKAIERQESEGYLHYYLNDIIMYDGEDLRDKPFIERAAKLEEVYNTHFQDVSFISVAKNIDADIYEAAAEALANGEEGMVLRKKDSKYECDKRPAWSSIKIKQEDTLDVVITGFCDPTKEYKGTELDSWEYWIEEPIDDIIKGIPAGQMIPVTKHYYFGWKNAIEISAYDNGELKKIGTVSSGLTDELRAAFAETPEKYLGKVVEIKCMSVDSNEHTIRHGYFQRFREDKNPEECTFSTIFN